MKQILALLAILALFTSTVRSQDKVYDTTSSHEMIEKGIALYDDDKPDKALEIYKSISPCDANYWWAMYESALVYYDRKEYETALKCCRESESLMPDNLSTISLISTILDEMGKNQEAIDFLKKALERWPYNQNLLYNLAACYYISQQMEKAEEVLIKSLHINPYHAGSNLLLAKVNFAMGRVAQSYLCFNMAILLRPSIGNLTVFENAVTGKLDSISHPYKYPYPQGADHRKWDELSALMKSEIAFGKKFDYDFDVNYLTARQSYLLFQRLKFDAADTSLYSQYYVRFFSELLDGDFFESCLNYSYKESKDPAIQKWMNRHEKKLNEFVNWAKTTINNLREYSFSVVNEKDKTTIYHYNDDGKLTSIGKLMHKPLPSREGEWIGIDPDGFVEKKGLYVNNDKEGEWLNYWSNGKVRQDIFYSKDKLNGNVKTYYSNGKIFGDYHFIQDNKDGRNVEYTPSGGILTDYSYNDNKLNGKKIDVYYKDGYSSEVNYLDDKFQGMYTETWLNGVKKAEVNTRDSLFDGSYQTWFANGELESRGTYAKGKLVGKYSSFYPDKIKSYEGEMNDSSELTGIKWAFARNGELESRDSAYIAGKLNGDLVLYFKDGSISQKISFKDNEIMATSCYDDKGKLLYQNEVKDEILPMKAYYHDGILLSEGNMKKSKRDGIWTFYDPFGRVEQVLSYNNGLQSGPQKLFHANGKLKEVYSCDSDRIIGPYSSYYSSGHLKVKGMYGKKGKYGEWQNYFGNDSLEAKSCYEEDRPCGRIFQYGLNAQLRSVENLSDEGKSIGIQLFDHKGKVRGEGSYKDDSVVIIEKYANDTIRSKRTYVNSLLEGRYETYLPNAKLYYIVPYKYGKVHGDVRRWTYDGQPEVEIPYVMGTIYGKLKRWMNGRLWYIDDYVNQELQGLHREFFPDGKLSARIRFTSDKKDGFADYFAADSLLAYRLVYTMGCLKAYSYCDAQGKLLPEIPLKPDTREILCYYPNGKISCKIPLKNGLIDGHSQVYFPDGKLMLEKDLVQGDLEGLVKFYYPNGNLRELITYQNDDRNGLNEQYYENGIKRATGNFVNENAEGEWKYFDPAGKLIHTVTYYFDEVYEIK